MDFTATQLTILQLKMRTSEQEARSALLQARSWEEAVRSLVAHLEQARPPEPLTNAGGVFSYIHSNQRVGVLLELQCISETVAQGGSFRRFARRLARQIALTGPRYVTALVIPPTERRALIHQVLKTVSTDHLPEEEREDFLRAKVNEKFAEQVLMMQMWSEDPSLTLNDLLTQVIAETGEKIVVSRFVRFSLDD